MRDVARGGRGGRGGSRGARVATGDLPPDRRPRRGKPTKMYMVIIHTYIKRKEKKTDRTSRQTQAGIGHSAPAHRGGHMRDRISRRQGKQNRTQCGGGATTHGLGTRQAGKSVPTQTHCVLIQRNKQASVTARLLRVHILRCTPPSPLQNILLCTLPCSCFFGAASMLLWDACESCM